MHDNKLIEQEVLHEIAMSIGTSLELEPMLAECIPVFIRGLGCSAAAVLLQDSECGFYTPHLILPKAAIRNRDLHQAMAIATDRHTARQLAQGPLVIPECSQHFYALPLAESGLLLLGRSQPFSHTLYMELGPLADKLAFALDACLRYQRLEQTQAAMSQARDEAQLANRAKSYFLATMSHEIRTPLNAVINLAQLLADTQLTASQWQLLQGITEGGQTLLQLVDDVMDFTQIEAGKVELHSASFSVREMLNGLVALYSRLAAEACLRFDAQIDEDTPDLVLGDEARIRQILQNMLANAVKFTKQGYVLLRVTPEPGSQRLRFTVIDSGIGLSDEAQTQILSIFAQEHVTMSHFPGGTGLGLAIVSQLVKAMDGEMGVTSRPHEGSTFWCSLPLESVDGARRPERRAIAHLGGHVLLVEDSPTNQLVAHSLLQKVGCQVDIVDNGADALLYLQRQMVDLVLMDISMPGMDGLETTRRIRQLGEAHQQLPIVAMTAHALQQDRAQCLAAGMSDYLVKPLQRALFYEVLQRWLTPASTDAAVHLPAAPTPAAQVLADVGAVNVLDEHQLQQLRNETSPQVFKQVILLFDAEVRQHLQALRNAIAADNWLDGARCAHAIKSSSGSLGAATVYRLSAAVELACRQQELPAAQLIDQLDMAIQQALQQLQLQLNATQS